MRRFEHPQDVLLPAHLRLRAQVYAVAVRGTVDYGDSNQTTPKVRGDHLTGKLGEEAVRLVYQSFGSTVEGPDYQIYTGRRKSWAADLKLGRGEADLRVIGGQSVAEATGEPGGDA